MTATFKYVFLTAAVASAAAGVLSWRSEPMSVERVFGLGSQPGHLTGELRLVSTPRGVPQLQMDSAGGGRKYVSCFAIPEACASLGSAASSSSLPFDAMVVPLARAVVWPVTVTEPAFAAMSKPLSQRRYAEYRDYQGSFWHFWAAFAAAMLVFAVWFRNRPIFPVR